MRLHISELDEFDRERIRYTVQDAVHTWPNDGGDETPGELSRRAFKFLRDRIVGQRYSLEAAIGELASDVERYRDM